MAEQVDSEVQRLAADDMKDGIVYRHVTWEPGASGMTEEDKARVLNNVRAQVKAQDEDRLLVRRADLKIVYAAMKRAIRLGQSTTEEWLVASTEVRELKGQIFRALDMALLHAGQMLPREDRDAIRAEIDAALAARASDPSP